MTFNRIRDNIGDIPLMSAEDGKILYEFILATRRRRILELGFAHGTSTCYMAAALEEQGDGSIVTVDNTSAREREPNIFSLLERTGLSPFVTPLFSEPSYTWELKNMIERQTSGNVTVPCFDFCFIDGAHAWEPDGLAFFLVEKLLVPGGWVLFDDLDWTYDRSSIRNDDWVKAMPDDYKATPQIDRVFSLLVLQHPSFEHFRREGRWGWAQKKSDLPGHSDAQLDSIYLDQSISGDSKRLLKKIAKRLLRRSA